MKVINKIVLLSLLAFSANALELSVNIEGIEKSEGSIKISLFSEAEKELFPMPDGVKRKFSKKAELEGVSFTIKNLPSGEYAVAVLHDENNNNKMDTFFGVPKEPYGNSGELTHLKPNYEDSKFVLNEDKSIVIKVH